MVTLALPPLAAAEQWVRAVDDPIVELLVATYLDPPTGDRTGLVAAAAGSPAIGAALGAQHDDGSWGTEERRERRILPTLWMAKTLAELGLGSLAHWTRAIGFLESTAHEADGVFAIDGRRDGVLSCYVGIAATTYLLGGRPDLAAPQVGWIVDHQQVKRAGRDLRQVPAQHWGDYLAVRYGGCMAATTCLVGLAKTAQALKCWAAECWAMERRSGPRPACEVDPILGAIREQFLDRRIVLASDGSVLPLGDSSATAETWLEPGYPLDWRTDLIEIIDLVSPCPDDPRVQPALERLAAFQLPDGTWPLLRSFRPPALSPLVRRSRRVGNPYITIRALCALRKLRGPGGPAGPE